MMRILDCWIFLLKEGTPPEIVVCNCVCHLRTPRSMCPIRHRTTADNAADSPDRLYVRRKLHRLIEIGLVVDTTMPNSINAENLPEIVP